LRFPVFDGGWEVKTLQEISENGFNNGVFNDPKKVGSGYRIINVKDMYVDGTIDTSTLTKVNIDEKEFIKNQVIYGDVFFTRSSLVKEGIAYSNINLNEDNDLTYDGHLIRMRPNKESYSPVFLYYNFGTSRTRRQFIIRGKTTTMTTIGQEDIASVSIKIPSLLEQQKIASFFTAIDQEISQLRRKKTLLEHYKKGVMQRIFSQEPDEGGSRTPIKNKQPREQIRFRDDNNKEFPKWEKKRLGLLCSIVGGGTPDTSINELWNGEIQWFTPTEIKSTYVSNSARTITELGLRKSSARKLPVGTILLTTRATIGECAIAERECTTNQGFQSLIVTEDANNYFLLNWLKMNKNELIKRANGSTFIEISKSEIENIPISSPSIGEQNKIANFMIAIDNKISHTQTQIEKAELWKKGLLQKMFM